MIERAGKVKLLILLESQVQVCIPFKDVLEHWQLSIVGTPLTEAHLG